MINNAARQLLLKKLPVSAVIQGWWIYLVVSAFGRTVYDSESRIMYRQHGGNAIGEPPGLLAKWRKRIRRFAKTGGLQVTSAQAREFCEIYGSSLSLDKKAVLDSLLDGRGTVVGRLRRAIWSGVYRQTLIDDIILRVLILLNRI